MAEYKEHIYLQKMEEGATCYDTIEQWGFWGKDVPFQAVGEVKEPYSNDWFDEDGDDEYIPDKLMMKGYEMEVEFGHRYYEKQTTGGGTTTDTTKDDLAAFIKYLTGKDGSGVEMMMYCTWTGIGRQKVRFAGINDKAEFVKDGNSCALMVKMRFKVNDPVTDVAVSDGVLVKV